MPALRHPAPERALPEPPCSPASHRATILDGDRRRREMVYVGRQEGGRVPLDLFQCRRCSSTAAVPVTLAAYRATEEVRR